MRITPTTQTRTFLENLDRLRTRENQAHTELSTGKAVNRLSDNPFAAAQASRITAVMAENDQFLAINEQLRGKLETTDSVLQAIIQSIDQGKTLAAQALSGTTTPESRTALATALEGVRQEILSASNTQFDGNFLFAGTQTSTTPFTDSGGIVTYQGNDEAIYQRLDRSVVIQANVTGQDVFMDSPSVFAVLENMKTAITNNDATAIRSGLADLETISSRMNSTAAVIGNNIQLTQQLENALRTHTQSLQEHVSTMTDANLAKSISDLNITTQAISAALGAQAQVQQFSLLDFLR
jgi:flagellar hook-associated protein 3 FlgL